MASTHAAYQNPTVPSQFPLRAASTSQSSSMARPSSEQMRTASNSGPPHHMADNTPFEDTTTLKGDYSGDAITLKGDHSPSGYPEEIHSRHNHHRKLERVTSKLETPRKWMGLQPTAPVAGDPDHAAHAHLAWSQTKLAFKEPFAEFWGTFILVLFGNAGLAQVTLGNKPGAGPGGQGFGDWQSVNWAFGIGLMLGIYVAGDSGAYLNPAVTLTSCVLRKLPWRRLPMYILAQTLGAFAAAGVVYANYYSLIHEYDPDLTVAPSPTATAGIFATYPTEGVSKVNQFFSQFIASGLLVFVIFALKDDSNKGNFVASGAWFPLALLFLMFGISNCFGMQTGFAINFARDFGPRVMTAALGYGSDVWTAGGYYFWIPIVAPFAGCLTGGLLYDIFIYTGESPVNTPWFGLAQLVNPKRTIVQRLESQKEGGLV